MYFDMHCHLDHEAFTGEHAVSEVIHRAQQAGVKAVVSNGTSAASNRAVLSLAENHSLIRPAYGLYPTEVGSTEEDETVFTWIREQALHSPHPPVAIGEIGLDGVEPVTEAQRIRFRSACLLAQELRLPVIIHSRKAEQDVFNELENLRLTVPIVMHCFGGSKKLVQEGVKRKYLFSIPAVIARATQFQMIAEFTPLPQLLTETDSPYLSANKENFPNEPVSVVQTVEHIARIKKITPEECRSLLFMNYRRTFS